MPVNPQSGRVVVELDPKLKQALHGALAARGLSLKAWFISCARDYLAEAAQPRFDFGGEDLPGRSEEKSKRSAKGTAGVGT